MSTLTLKHEDFCLPRPGLDEPRVESYYATSYADDGITIAGNIRVVRCCECAAASYDGVQRP